MATHEHRRPPAVDRGDWWRWWVPRLLFVAGAVGLVVVSASGWSLTALWFTAVFLLIMVRFWDYWSTLL